MEIPVELKGLYRHWEFHTREVERKSSVKVPRPIETFISERMRIWELKYKGKAKPYTKDPLLQKYRFCNIYRELDHQTIEIHKSLSQHRDQFQLWLLNVAFQRFICNPDTVEKIGSLSFSVRHNEKVIANLKGLQSPKYGAAYIFPISLIQKSDHPTREEFFCKYLPEAIPRVARKLESFKKMSVNEALEIILPIFGFNFRFHWTEILIDVAYQFPQKIDLFRDFYVGPGALPTANQLNSNLDPSEVVDSVVGTELIDFHHLQFEGNDVILSAENWEGIFCEYRKYSNLKAGKGRRRLFR